MEIAHKKRTVRHKGEEGNRRKMLKHTHAQNLGVRPTAFFFSFFAAYPNPRDLPKPREKTVARSDSATRMWRHVIGIATSRQPRQRFRYLLMVLRATYTLCSKFKKRKDSVQIILLVRRSVDILIRGLFIVHASKKYTSWINQVINHFYTLVSYHIMASSTAPRHRSSFKGRSCVFFFVKGTERERERERCERDSTSKTYFL